MNRPLPNQIHARLAAPVLVAVLVLPACNATDDVTAARPEATGTANTADTGDSVGRVADDTTPEAETSPSAEAASTDDLGGVGALASDEIHTIELEFDVGDFEAMVAEYQSTGEKEWIEATVTIDGTTFEQVGIRLKGNSSLRGVAADDDPTTLPWLIRLDEYVDGQHLDGLTELVVRSNGSQTALNEAVALELLSLAGLASQDAIGASFTVNGSDALYRLVIDNPDDTWMHEMLDSDGALYKAESTGDYSYRGDDPAAYDDVFDQEAGDDNADLTPLIEFLQFIGETDDATFADELDDWLDVDAFATYLAMQDLLGNFDDIDGPGNNSYLFYDTDSERFTVVPWDHNLAFGGSIGGGPGGGSPGGRGGGFPGGQDGEAPPEFALPDGFEPGDRPGGELPDGFEPGDRPGGELPDGFEPGDRPGGELPEGFEPGDRPGGGQFPGGGRGGFGGRSNVLVDRFLAVDEWSELVETRTTELQAELFDSGVAQDVLDAWSALVATSGLLDEATIADEAAAIATQF